ncbi:MAG: recombination mediator RecR [Gammaproteobacteria bacterium]|nr:recombination mediator RecR [Gammaproteobacteria bacterium]MDH5516051.1 recombination mediator RecR [Gammaproteobacteria bacterium]
MSGSRLIGRLIESLRCLPGVGPRSAQRMAYHLLEHNRDGGRQLAEILTLAMDQVGNCDACRTLSETQTCAICANPRRDRSKLCVVETPADVQALEQSTGFQGLYFVLLGHLSPLDGVGPEQLGLELLEARLASGEVAELIIATNPTVEGEATAHFVSELARVHGVAATRIAHGVPMGGELEYIDSGTLSHAFASRREV